MGQGPLREWKPKRVVVERYTLMTFDELAARVVGLESAEGEELQTIRAALDAIGQDDSMPDAARRIAAQISASIQAADATSRPDSHRILMELRQAVDAMQKIIENAEMQLPSAAGPAAGAAFQDVAHDENENVFENDPEILQEFINESIDHLQTSESALLSLESNPGDMESLNTVFRAFHSTKGTASFIGLTHIKELAHHAEMLLDRARKGEIRLQGVFADLALESADMLKIMINNLAKKTGTEAVAPPENYRQLLMRLEHPEGMIPAETAAAAKADVAGAEPLRIDNEEEPAPKPAPAVEAPPEVRARDVVIQGKAAITAEAQAETAAVKNESTAVAAATVRVSTDKLDGLINMVGELVITQAMISQSDILKVDGNRQLSRNVIQLTRITRELQDLSMSLRMVPLKATFQKMERVVRDVAKKSKKAVRFIVEGEDTEIDRNMVESLSDPLVHMLRNSVDHGIEPAEARRASGKPETGTVGLRAYHAAGNVVLEIRDDGRGLNREVILAKAVEKGLAGAERELTDNEIYKMIFLPGFSTAAVVTDVSGRGVGLDVVKKNLDSLRGRIDISSVTGRETVFTLRIPLTLAIIDGMLIRVGRQQYILPTLNVQKAFRPENEVLFSVQGRGEMVRVREKLIPVFRLHEMFRVADAVKDPMQALLLEVEHEGESCALLADALLGQQQVVIKSLPAGLGETRGLSGSAILGDGRIGMILDVAGIMDLALGRNSKVEAMQ